MSFGGSRSVVCVILTGPSLSMLASISNCCCLKSGHLKNTCSKSFIIWQFSQFLSAMCCSAGNNEDFNFNRVYIESNDF